MQPCNPEAHEEIYHIPKMCLLIFSAEQSQDLLQKIDIRTMQKPHLLCSLQNS